MPPVPFDHVMGGNDEKDIRDRDTVDMDCTGLDEPDRVFMVTGDPESGQDFGEAGHAALRWSDRAQEGAPLRAGRLSDRPAWSTMVVATHTMEELVHPKPMLMQAGQCPR